MHDLMMIAALTGARLEAIVDLRARDCEAGLFTFKPQKKEKSARGEPIHSALVDLVARFAGRLPKDVAEAELRRVDAAGAENLWFAWAGATERPARPGEGSRHYYRVQGSGLLIEHDNTQSGGNHIHSVWRVPGGDFGDDLLAAHYRAEKH